MKLPITLPQKPYSLYAEILPINASSQQLDQPHMIRFWSYDHHELTDKQRKISEFILDKTEINMLIKILQTIN